MNEPRGPLEPSVYRRRRVVAMAGFGVGAVLFIWAVGALLGGGDVPTVRGAANVQPDGVPLLTTSAPSSNPPSSGPLAESGDPSSSASALQSTSVPTTVTVTPTTTTPVPTTTTPAPPTACPDSVIRLSMTTDKPSYPAGSQPMLTLHIANAGAATCIRDVSHQLRSIEVRPASSTTPVWASDDCYSVDTNDLDTLQPGESLSFSVQWAGRTAAPGCPTDRTTVPAGSYEVTGTLGKLVSPPAPLILTAA